MAAALVQIVLAGDLGQQRQAHGVQLVGWLARAGVPSWGPELLAVVDSAALFLVL